MGERTFVQEASILSGQTFMGYPRRHGFGYRRVVEGDLLPTKNVVDIHARCPTKREHEVPQPRGCSGRARDEVDMGSGLQVVRGACRSNTDRERISVFLIILIGGSMRAGGIRGPCSLSSCAWKVASDRVNRIVSVYSQPTAPATAIVNSALKLSVLKHPIADTRAVPERMAAFGIFVRRAERPQ